MGFVMFIDDYSRCVCFINHKTGVFKKFKLFEAIETRVWADNEIQDNGGMCLGISHIQRNWAPADSTTFFSTEWLPISETVLYLLKSSLHPLRNGIVTKPISAISKYLGVQPKILSLVLKAYKKAQRMCFISYGKNRKGILVDQFEHKQRCHQKRCFRVYNLKFIFEWDFFT